MNSINTVSAVPNILPVVPIQDEILTVNEVAELLKMSREQVYEQTRNRARVRNAHPIPAIRINGNLRFRRSDIERWLDRLSESERGTVNE
jgi:excisionase family DNA binding protein